MSEDVAKSERMRDGIVKRGKSYSYVVTKEGKKVWKGGFETRAAAKSARARALVSIQNRTFIDPSKILLGDFLTTWLDIHSRTLKVKTQVSYRSHLTQYILPRLGHMKVQEIRPSDLEKYFGELGTSGSQKGGKLSARTVTYNAAILKKALKYAVEVDQILTKSPALKVTVPKGDTKDLNLWSIRELEIFLTGMRSNRLYLFFHLAAYTGARRGELLALRWSDFDDKALSISKSRVQAGSVTIEQNTTKGGENGQRRVILDPKTIEEVTAHRKRQIIERLSIGSAWMDTGYIFVKEDGSPIYASTPTALFTKMAKKLGLLNSPSTSGSNGMSLHGLRHIHATELLRLGEPLHVVAKRLGHRDAMVTATIYAHANDEQAETAASRFADAVSRQA